MPFQCKIKRMSTVFFKGFAIVVNQLHIYINGEKVAGSSVP